ncbi:MAG: hypothetical protein M3004_04520 [Bacteroidota bacterium]|nr:hypothetical protein [Bacteroidota bacterium]
MEVHNHPNHVTHKKKWGEYLLEFLMLFLAVFLGFVAENIRENIVEQHREKEYIKSMIQDLKTDTTNLGNLIIVYDARIRIQDSLMLSFDSINNGQYRLFMRNIKSITGFPDFINADATVQQLKNSGGFRLIKNKSAVDSIMAYTSRVQSTLINQSSLSALLKELNAVRYEIINYRELFKEQMNAKAKEQIKAEPIDYLQIHDKRELEKFFDKIYRFQDLMRIIQSINFVPLKQHAARLIVFLQKEYHLQNE